MKTKKFLIAIIIGVFTLAIIADEDLSAWEEDKFFQKENVQEVEEQIIDQTTKTGEDLMEHEQMLQEKEKEKKKSITDYWEAFFNDFLD